VQDVLYGFMSEAPNKKDFVQISMTNGKSAIISQADILRSHPTTSVENGLMAIYLKEGAKLLVEITTGDDAFSVYANTPIRSFPKYYDDDGGTPLKSYDDPLSAPSSFPKFYDDDGGTPRKSYDDPMRSPATNPKYLDDGACPSKHLDDDIGYMRSRMARRNLEGPYTGAPKHIEDTATPMEWPHW